LTKYVSNQQIDDVHTLFGIFPQKTRKAKSVVIECINQLAHRLDTAIDFRLILSEALGGKVVVIEGVVNRVGSKLRHLQRQQHARGVDRIEKSVGIADDDESVAGVVF